MALPTHTEEVNRLMDSVKDISPEEADDSLLISNDCICRSAAGYYVGSWCIEWIQEGLEYHDGYWLAQPYDRYYREFGYFKTHEKAQEFAKRMGLPEESELDFDELNKVITGVS